MLSDPPSASQFSSPNMSDKSAAPAISDPSPQQELESLISLVAALSQMSLAMTKHCLDVQTKLPRVVNAAAAAGIAAPITPAVASPTWVQLVALTPDQLDAAHPTGNLDDIAYHVVTIGRDPGLYTGTTESDYQVLGVPDGKRRRIVGRAAALAYYRDMYTKQKVARWGPAPAAVPVASTSSTPARPARQH
ncbi:hypothetical protein B0H13DRAFT_2385972 [Mycena leptocephala]|nr:hypothetical protein B0H13DRAFT_2385972 [Mycena leptocephala]